MNTCNICKEYKNSYYKICICNSSYICGDCLNYMHHYRSYTCPICRRKLNLARIFHKRKYCLSISSNLILFSLLLLFECIIPVIYFLNIKDADGNDYKMGDMILDFGYNNRALIPSIFIAVFIIKPINIIIYNYMFDIGIEECVTRNKDLITNIVIYNIIIVTVLFPMNLKKIRVIYFGLVIFLTHWMFLISGMIFLFFINLKYAFNYFSTSNFTSNRIVPISRITNNSNNNSDSDNNSNNSDYNNDSDNSIISEYSNRIESTAV